MLPAKLFIVETALKHQYLTKIYCARVSSGNYRRANNNNEGKEKFCFIKMLKNHKKRSNECAKWKYQKEGKKIYLHRK